MPRIRLEKRGVLGRNGDQQTIRGIRKLASGRYQARYYLLGKQVPADPTFATKADARAWVSSVETELSSGRHLSPNAGRELSGDFASRWLEIMTS